MKREVERTEGERCVALKLMVFVAEPKYCRLVNIVAFVEIEIEKYVLRYYLGVPAFPLVYSVNKDWFLLKGAVRYRKIQFGTCKLIAVRTGAVGLHKKNALVAVVSVRPFSYQHVLHQNLLNEIKCSFAFGVHTKI